MREPEKVSTGQQHEHDEKNITYQASPSVPFTSGLIEFMVRKQFLRSLQFFRGMPVALYSTANDPPTANDPQNGPQMILDRK